MQRIIASCPSCGGNRLFLTRYDAPLKLLKDRSWLLCKDCDYEIETEQLKKLLWCV